jgi:hypothetical protein
MIYAYFAPEVVFPVASALAGVFGFIMLMGRTPFRVVSRAFRASTGALQKLARKLNF